MGGAQPGGGLPAAAGNVAPVEPPGDDRRRHAHGHASEADGVSGDGLDGLLWGSGYLWRDWGRRDREAECESSSRGDKKRRPSGAGREATGCSDKDEELEQTAWARRSPCASLRTLSETRGEQAGDLWAASHIQEQPYGLIIQGRQNRRKEMELSATAFGDGPLAEKMKRASISEWAENGLAEMDTEGCSTRTVRVRQRPPFQRQPVLGNRLLLWGFPGESAPI